MKTKLLILITLLLIAQLVGATLVENEKSSIAYKVLEKSLSFEDQVCENNTVYEIRDVFVLTKDINIPKNSTLLFRGGRIEGCACLIGNSSLIDAVPVNILGSNISLKGTWNQDKAYSEWFGGSIAREDNVIAMQKCLDYFNILTLCVGTYKISNSLNINKDGGIICGIASSRSEIQKTKNKGQSINAIINIKSSIDRNLQHIKLSDFKISSYRYNADYGIYTLGVNSSEFKNIEVFQCKNGFYCKNETHGALWGLIFENVTINCNSLHGFEGIKSYGYPKGESCAVTCITNGGANIIFSHCWARDCAIGYHIKGINYSMMNSCSADNIHRSAYLIEYSRMSLNSCGMENILTNAAIVLYHSSVTLNSFEDFGMIASSQGEVYRIKIDGGRATLVNCNFVEWINKYSNPYVYGVTSDNGSKVLLINTLQLKNINKYMRLKNGATIKVIE